VQGDLDCAPATDTVRVEALLPRRHGPRAARYVVLPFGRAHPKYSGTWSGPGVSGSLAAFVFTPTPQLVGPQFLLYTGPLTNNPLCPGRTRRIVTVRSAGLAEAARYGAVRRGRPAAPTRYAHWRRVERGVTGYVGAGFVFTPSAALRRWTASGRYRAGADAEGLLGLG
jgi:hypothetical protein